MRGDLAETCVSRRAGLLVARKLAGALDLASVAVPVELRRARDPSRRRGRLGRPALRARGARRTPARQDARAAGAHGAARIASLPIAPVPRTRCAAGARGSGNRAPLVEAPSVPVLVRQLPDRARCWCSAHREARGSSARSSGAARGSPRGARRRGASDRSGAAVHRVAGGDLATAARSDAFAADGIAVPATGRSTTGARARLEWCRDGTLLPGGARVTISAGDPVRLGLPAPHRARTSASRPADRPARRASGSGRAAACAPRSTSCARSSPGRRSPAPGAGSARAAATTSGTRPPARRGVARRPKSSWMRAATDGGRSGS